MRNFISVILLIPVLLIIACDENLFKPGDETSDPEVSEIKSDLSDFRIDAGGTARFWVDASDPDGGVLNFLWSSSGGDFLTSRQEDSVSWLAPLQGGDYSVQVKVSNKDKTVTRNRTITVRSLDKPIVAILSPVEGAFLVQYETVTIEADAFHDNGISTVEFFINDISIDLVDGNHTTSYSHDWVIESTAGPTEIKVEAKARITSTISADSILVSVEGVIPGKK